MTKVWIGDVVAFDADIQSVELLRCFTASDSPSIEVEISIFS